MRDLGLQIARIGVEWARIEPENGVFDTTTEDAVKQFQAGFGLPVTGTIDYETWRAIYDFYNT